MNLLIFDVLSMTAGITVLYVMMKQAVKELRLRKRGKEYEGEIVGSCWSSGEGTRSRQHVYFCPVVRIKGRQKLLNSVRVLQCRFFKKKEDYYGQTLAIIYNPRYPGVCTYGKAYPVMLKWAVLTIAGGFMLVIGSCGILNYI